MPSETTLLGIPTDLLVQVATGFMVLFWGWTEARKHYKATKDQVKPQNPAVAGFSMAWDRDMQERFLQLIERLTKAAEAQASMQASMSSTWSGMADTKQKEMGDHIQNLLKTLERVEQELSDEKHRPARS